MKTETNQYEQQAAEFLTKNALKFRATLSDTKTPAWAKAGAEHGHHYRVTISRCNAQETTLRNPRAYSLDGKPGVFVTKNRLVFDFWGSVADARANRHPSAQDVLSCISSDAHTPDSFEEFCSEYGYEHDSIKALQTFRRHSAFAKRLKAFFTASELEQLSEINSW